MRAAYKRFDDVAVGQHFPAEPLRFEVSRDAVEAFLDATGNGRRGEGPPSMLACVYLVELLKARLSPPGGIHAKQSIRFHRRLEFAETLSLQARIIEKFVRKEKPYVVSQFEALGADGRPVASGRITAIWGGDQ